MNVHRLRDGKTAPELLERWVKALGVNVEGIVGGYTGPQFYTMLPQRATAKIDLRLPPGPTTGQVLALLRAHLDRRGFHDVQIRYERGYEGQRTPTGDPIVQSAIRAAEVHGVATSIWPTANAFCPGSLFARPPFNLPSVWTGLGHGERLHAPEEYIEVDAVRKYMHFAATYLHGWAVAR
jgi:acetylornithine deacetylase/succinyl-diaminopimelate desuccinylase-like protein